MRNWDNTHHSRPRGSCAPSLPGWPAHPAAHLAKYCQTLAPAAKAGLMVPCGALSRGRVEHLHIPEQRVKRAGIAAESGLQSTGTVNVDAPACANGTLVLRTQLARACRHQAGRMRRVGRRQKPALRQRAGARSAKPAKPQKNRLPLWCSASLHAPAPHAGAWMRAWCAAKANGGVASTPWQALQRLEVSERAMGSVRRSLPELVDESGLTRTSVIPEQPVLERKGAQGGVELASGVSRGGQALPTISPPHTTFSLLT